MKLGSVHWEMENWQKLRIIVLSVTNPNLTFLFAHPPQDSASELMFQAESLKTLPFVPFLNRTERQSGFYTGNDRMDTKKECTKVQQTQRAHGTLPFLLN